MSGSNNEYKRVWGVSKKTFKRRAAKLVQDVSLPKLNCQQNVPPHVTVPSSSGSSSSINRLDIPSQKRESPQAQIENQCPINNEMLINKLSLKEKLSSWAIDFNISGAATSKLLNILKEEGHDLPKDCRTLLHTPTQSTTISIGSCQKIIHKEPMFNYPISSENLDIYQSSGLLNISENINIEYVESKVMGINLNDTFYFFPLVN